MKFDYITTNFLASKLGCLLLHCNNPNSSNDINHFNPFMMMPINMRVELEKERFVLFDTNEHKQKNILWNMVNCTDPIHSPLEGVYKGSLASFQVADQGNRMAKLSSVHGTLEALNVYAIPPDSEAVLKALKWLDPHASVSPGATLYELVDQFIKSLHDSHVPNGTVDQLIEFIRSRTWDEKRLWGGTVAGFLARIEGIDDQVEKWRLLRFFITCNMAWQTKLIYIPSDALHREAGSIMAFNGVYLPGTNLELQKHVTNYVQKLVPVDDKHRQLSIRTEEGFTTPIDCSVKLWYDIPNLGSFDDPEYFLCSQHMSATTQGNQQKMVPHTVIHLLASFLGYFRNMEFPFLYYPGDTVHGIESTLCGKMVDAEVLKDLSDNEKIARFKSAFKDILLDNGLCDSESSWTNLAIRIENEVRNFSWTRESWFSTVYIHLWLEKFAKHAFHVLKKIAGSYTNFTNVDPILGLDSLVDMKEEVFLRMFQHNQWSNYLRDGLLDSYRLDALKGPTTKEPPVYAVFKKRRGLDMKKGDPYKKPTGEMDQKKIEYFCPSLLEFVHIILYAHLSEDSYNKISLLTSPSTTSLVTPENEDRRGLSRRYLRCVIFSMSCSHVTSAKCWQVGYFPKDTTSTSILANKMSRPTQMLFLMMSAISETCPFYQSIGINPSMPDLTGPIEAWIEEKEIEEFKEVLADPVILYTFFFCHQAYLQEKKFRQEERKYCCDVLDNTLRTLPDPRLTEVTTFRKDDKWLGHYTLGGAKTLSMSPDPDDRKGLPELSRLKGHLLVVLADVRYNEAQPPEIPDSPQDSPVTHSITQFSKWPLHYSSLFEYLEKSSQGNPPPSVDHSVRETLGVPSVTDQVVTEGGIESSAVPDPEEKIVECIGNDLAADYGNLSVAQGVSAEVAEEFDEENYVNAVLAGASASDDAASAAAAASASATAVNVVEAASDTVAKFAANASPTAAAAVEAAAAAANVPANVAASAAAESEAAVLAPRRAVLVEVAAESIAGLYHAVAGSRANDQVMEGNEGADTPQPPRKRRKGQGSPTEEGGRSGEGRKPRKKSRKGEEDEENQSDSQPTAKQAAVAVEGKKGPITLNDVSEALKKFAPKVIDLTNEGNVNEKEIEKEFSELDEVAKTQCLLIFFKLWTRCNEIDKSNKRKEAWKSHPYVDDEAGCDDMKDDEGEFLENEEDHHFINHEHVDDEGYNPNHRNIPDEMRGQPQGESEGDSGDDISALTMRNGPHYVGEGPLSPTGGYESDSISARRRQSQMGKTPEDERDDEGERNFIDH
jgi:hypothetical protein